MRALTPSRFILRRLNGDWKLLLIAFLGVVIATSLIAGTPIYLDALERLGLHHVVDRSNPVVLNIFTTARNLHLSAENIERVEESVEAAFLSNIPDTYGGHERLLRTDQQVFNPVQNIPEPRVALALSPEQVAAHANLEGSLAYLTNLFGLQDNVTVVEGRMPGRNVEEDLERYPRVVGIAEAVIGLPVARAHDLRIGDVLTLATSTAARDWSRASARIVGVVEATDPGAEYWQGRADLFFGPPALLQAPDVGLEIDPSVPPAALIITVEAASVLPDELVQASRRQRWRSGSRDRRAIIPEPKVMMALSEEQSRRQAEMTASLGYLTHLEGLPDHVTLVDGRMAGDIISADPETHPLIDRIVEAVVGVEVARRHDLQIGELVTLIPSALFLSNAAARIVGIVDVTDPSEEYWQGRSSVFFDPPALESAPDLGVLVGPQEPPIALIIHPAAAPKLSRDLVAPPSYESEPSVFATLTRLEENITIEAGRVPDDSVSSGPRGPIVEAMLTAPLHRLYDVKIGDEVIVTPFIDEPVRVTAKIVGIASRDDPESEYWQSTFSGLFVAPPELEPPPFPPEPPPPLAFLVQQNIMVDTLADAYPGTLIDANWLTYMDKEELKQMSSSDTRQTLEDLDNELTDVVRVHTITTGLKTILNDFDRRVFFARIPLLLLLATMIVAVLYFLSMMVSYVVKSRESDLAALKTRGVSIRHIVRLYGTEGLVVALAAVVLAPFIAMAATALAGTLPYFERLTGGEPLPVRWSMLPFLMAIGAGVLCLFLLIIPAVLAARAGQLAHRLRSSRPPSVPFFHRYYLDIGLLVIGSLVFLELRSRDELVVGGLFKDAQINEALLLTPVLFLTVVALVFIRFFPLVLRYVSGESPVLLHFLFGATVAPLGVAIAVREEVTGNGLAWAPAVGLLTALAWVYWATQRAGGGWLRIGALALQALLVGLFVLREPPELGTLNVLSTTILVAIVPAQLLFQLFKAISRRSPVWVSLALWSMARNPLQYTWPVLLLVLVTGLATFSTTVGATLDRKDEERILYSVVTDIRVTGANQLDGWALRDRYVDVQGVDVVSPAYRGVGESLPDVSRSFKALGVQSDIFASISWYRDDFSTRPLRQVMEGLRTENSSEPLPLPNGATGVGVWAKLRQDSPALALSMVLRDGQGAMTVVDLGRLLHVDWHLMSAELPTDLETPVHLVSVRIRPSSGVVSNPGGALIDDIFVTLGDNGDGMVIDDFERRSGWTAMPASLKASESVFEISGDSHQGVAAGSYSYGDGATSGVSGIYLSPSGGPLPVAISSSIMPGVEDSVGTPFIGTINNRLVSMVVSDTVEYFPTMDPENGGFVVADLDLLFMHLRIAAPDRRFTPNEFFFGLDPDAGPDTTSGVRRTTPFPARMLHGDGMRDLMVASIGLDPLVTAGWRAMALLSIAIVLFAGGTGYLTYLLFFAERRRGEVDLVRSMGLQHGQMIGLLSLEHLVIVLVGVGLGVWAGLRMSALTVPSVSAAEAGGPVLPPVLVTADWWVLAAVCAALVFGFVQMLLLLKRRVFRSDLQAISRRIEV